MFKIKNAKMNVSYVFEGDSSVSKAIKLFGREQLSCIIFRHSRCQDLPDFPLYQSNYNQCLPYQMMNCCLGARNTVGFTKTLEKGRLPPYTHLTYEGLFNEIRYNVGPKTDKTLDLHIGYSRFQFLKSQFDNEINDYLALFLKGKSDGQERQENVKMNLMICLDISGSMSCGLGENQQSETNESRLSLSLEAIKMLISKLKPNDSLGMVTFNTFASVIFESTFKKTLTSEIFERLDKISANGGTNIMNGFKKSCELLSNWMEKHKDPKAENRIIMLTDVCDQSFSNYREFVEKVANENGIHTSIIGISTEFQSSLCEVFKEIKGFNYFCAVNQEDIRKYVFETFDFGFFPSATNVQIILQAENIEAIEVFGTPDSDKVKQYRLTSMGNLWPISKVKSCFPSEIQIQAETVYTVGGLILIKIKKSAKSSSFKGRALLKYEDPEGKIFNQAYPLNFEFHPEEQFFSGEELREAIEGFAFTAELRQILKDCSKIANETEIYNKFWPMLVNLQPLCPKQKLKQYENIKKIVQTYRPKQLEISLAEKQG